MALKLVDAQVMGRKAPDCLLRSSDLLHAVLNKAHDNKKLVSVSIIECAEAALEAGDVATARKCVETFFAESRRYDAECKPLPLTNQYACRAQYALALVISAEVQHNKGPELVAGCLEALQQLMKGLDLAASVPRYSHLIYNGSVHFWKVSRPLQRERLRQQLLPFQEKVYQALEKVPGHEEWRVRHQMSLALCCLDAGRGDDGVRHAAAAATLAAGSNLPILEEAARLQSFVEAAAAKASATGGKAAAGKKAAAPSGAAAVAAAAAGAAKGGAAPALTPGELQCLSLVQSVAATRPEKAAAEQQLREAWTKVDPNPQGPSKGVNMKMVARVAWCAAVVSLLELAEQCASRAAAAQDVLPRAWSEIVRALLSLQAAGQPSQAPDSTAAKVYIQIMEQLDDAITSLLRLRDVDGIHECCRLIWNTGLPLLQPELRQHVKRTFASAAKALDVIASPLHQLRAQLHLEIAKCELADESQLKALQEVHKGLALDYVVAPEEEARWQLQRPLDRFLMPLAAAGRLRSEEPSSLEEEGLLLLERSKESRSPAIRADYIRKAMAKLSQVPVPAAPQASDTEQPSRRLQQNTCRRLTALWGEVVQSAWAGKLGELALEAAPHAAAPEWCAAVDKEMVMLQAELSYVEAEACAAALQKYRQDVVPPLKPSPPDVGAAGVRQAPSTVEQLQHVFCEALMRGMSLALDAEEAWQVANGAVRAWNIMLPLLRQQRHGELRLLLEGVAERLLQLPAESTSGSLLASLVSAYAQSVEHCYLLALLQPVPTAPEGQDAPGAGSPAADPSVPAGEVASWGWRFGETEGYEVLPKARAKAVGASAEAQQKPAVVQAHLELAKGSSACERALAKLGSVQAQRLLEAYARLQQLQGRPAVVPSGSSRVSEQTSKVVKIIEGIIQAADTQPPAKLEADAAEAVALLSAMPVVNVELWAKLGRAAAARRLWATAVQCCRSAFEALPEEAQQGAVESVSEAPAVVPQTWFWLAVATVAHGEAIAALLRDKGQDAAAATRLRAAAADQFLAAAKYASFVGKSDLVEAAVQKLWNTVVPAMREPVVLRALQPQLQAAVGLLNKCKPSNTAFQVQANCAVLWGCMAAGRLQEALELCTAALKGLPQASHVELLVCKSTILARWGQQVPEEMSRLGVYPAPVQAEAWAALAHEASNRADQVEGHRRALEAVKAYPWLASQHLLGYAEWLYCSGPSGDLEALEDALVAAAGHLVDLDAAPQGKPPGSAAPGATTRLTADLLSAASPPQRSLSHSPSRTPSMASSAAGQRSLADLAASAKRSARASASDSKAAGKDQDGGAAGGGWASRPKELQAVHMEQLLRIFYLLSKATLGRQEEHTNYLMAAHYYATRLAASALAAAAARVAAAGAEPSAAAPTPSTRSLQSWATFQCSEALGAQLAADSTPGGISRASMPKPELTLAYLAALSRDLQRGNYHLHALPICHLSVLVSRYALGSESMAAAASLQLAALLDNLALPEAAAAVEASVVNPASLPASEQQLAQDDVALRTWVEGALAEVASRPRSAAMSVGRLSFLGLPTGRPKSRSRPPSREGPGSYPAAAAEGGAVDPVKAEERWGPLLAAAQEVASMGQEGSGAQAVPHASWLQPLTAHDAWLLRAQHLARRGHFATATHLAKKALEHARARDSREGEAQCLLLLAQQLLWARQPDEGVLLVQQAQEVGGDPAFWVDCIACYVGCRLAGRLGAYDAWDALQGGLQLFQAVARGGKLGQAEARAAEAAVKLQMSRLAAAEAAKIPGPAAAQAKHQQALAAAQSAAATFQQLGLHPQFIAAVLEQVDVMGRHPGAVGDKRPGLQQRIELLKAAESAAQELLRAVCPVGLPSTISLPAARLLADVQLCLADLHLQLAREQQRLAVADRTAQRPAFPVVDSAKDAAAVTRFVDEVDAEEGAKVLRVLPEDVAMIYATSAANLAGFGWRKAKAMRLLGGTLHLKFLGSVPPALHPDQAPKSHLQSLAPLVPLPREADAESEAPVAAKAAAPASPGKKKGGASKEPPKTPPPQPPAAAPVPPLQALDSAPAAQQPPAESLQDTPQGRAAAALHSQALQSLQAAAGLAQQQGDWGGLREAALQLVACYSHAMPREAAESLCWAQSALTATAMEDLLEHATAPQDPEYLLHKQATLLAAALPLPGQSPHFQRSRNNLRAAGPSHTALHSTLPPKQILASLPLSLTTLVLHLSPDRTTLHFAAINAPGPPPTTPPPATPSGKPSKSAGPPQPDVSRITIIDSMSVTHADLQALYHHARTWRRALRKILLDPKTPLPASLLPPPTTDPAPTTTANPSPTATPRSAPVKNPASSRPGSGTPAAKGGRLGSPRPGARIGAVVGDAAPQQRTFSEEVNASWRWLVAKLEKFLEPLQPALQAALPAPGPQGPTSGRQQVCLLLDMELATLPWEALPLLQQTSVSRCFSLHLLHACLPPPGEPAVGDLGTMACIVDPCHEQSAPQDVPPGAYNVPVLPTFKEVAGGPYGKDWTVLEGEPSKTPGDAEYQQVLRGAGGLLFFGPSRLLAFLRPQVLASLDLRGCSLALVLDRADGAAARHRQQQADNCKAAEALLLESPTRTAALLMMRGVRTVVLNSTASTSWANGQVLAGAMKQLAAGQQVGAAVDGVRRAVGEGYELEYMAAGLQVYGVPWLVCTPGAGGAKGGAKGGAGKK